MYQAVLFAHFLAIALAFFATGLLYGGMQRLQRSQSVEEARAAAAQAGGAAKLHPIATLLLFLTGAYMTQASWTWSTPWIDCGIVALFIVAVMGGGVLGGRERSLERVLHEAPEGPIAAALRERIQDPLLAVGGAAIPIFVFAIMLLMVVKPALTGSLLILIAGALLGIGLGLTTLPSHKRAEATAEAQRSNA